MARRPKKETTTTAAYRLYHFYHKVIVPQHAMQIHHPRRASLESNDPSYDAELAHADTVGEFTAVQLVELFDHGVYPRLVDEREALTVYDNIMQHLNDWRYFQLTDTEELRIPEEDLIKLNNFAEWLFLEHVRYQRESPEHEAMDKVRSEIRGSRITGKLRAGPAKPIDERKHSSPLDHILVENLQRKDRKWQ